MVVQRSRENGFSKIRESLGLSEPHTISDKAFQAYLVEYEQCMESYRHAVSTIWRAATVTAAIAAGLIAFTPFSGNTGSSQGDSVLTQVPALVPPILGLLPLIVWCFGIYHPLNRYAERKCDNLCRIEELLSRGVADLEMRHFREYKELRRGQANGSLWSRIVTLRILREPRIVEVVAISGFSLVIVEVALVALLVTSLVS